MNKIMYFLLGIILISISTIFFLMYTNLINIGYSLLDYILYCLKRIECLLIIPGIIILYFKYIKN